MKYSRHYKKIILFSLTGIIAFIAGYFLASYTVTKKYEAFIDSISLKRENDSSYPFVHPLTGFSSSNAATVGEFAPLAQKIQAVFSAHTSVLSRYSVYFKDENQGFWVGINENDTYNPASMLKIVFAIAAYKESESNPNFLSQEEIYTPAIAAINTNLQFALPSELVVNHAYTINDLIEKMIVDSDNGAKNILGNVIDPNIIQNVYTTLGVAGPVNGQNYTISPKEYTVFFKTLYNGSYLSQQDSNTLLLMLSSATFNDGLVAGVPSGTVVAHKYGEFVNDANNTPTSMELHDCGIVYLPKNPYVLCVMTEGTNETDLSAVIADVSRVVYTEVNNNYQ